MEADDSYSNERLQAIKKKFDIYEGSSIPRITLYTIKELCKKFGLLQTTELNDKMYFHHQGFRKIENMHYLSGLKTLWLHGNSISVIENLEPCADLRALYAYHFLLFLDLILDTCKIM